MNRPDTMLLHKKLDELTSKTLDLMPIETRPIELTHGEAMLLWQCLSLRDALKNLTQ